MNIISNKRRFAKRLAAVSAGAALIATGAIGAHSFAEGGGEGGPPSPPGQEPIGEEGEPVADDGGLVLGTDELIQSSGTSYDETIVSKFISAQSFQVFQGEVTGADTVAPGDSAFADTCVAPGPNSGGTRTQMASAVELPDGARIKQISFYGQDNDAGDDIVVDLLREEFSTPFALFPLTPTSSRTRTEIDSFSTSGQQADASVFFGTNDLEEVTGNFRSGGGTFIGPFLNRFHTVRVSMQNGADHVLCGVRVDYQVPAVADPGATFHPVEPFRAFDSRQAAFTESGRLAPNATKVIDITDGYDSSGVLIPAQENLVPSNATAVTFNITAAGQTGPNFVAVTAGDAASFTASTINYTGGGNIANASTVTVAADQTIKLWGGGNTGSAHVIIDITGYYAPAPYPNMAN